MGTPTIVKKEIEGFGLWCRVWLLVRYDIPKVRSTLGIVAWKVVAR